MCLCRKKCIRIVRFKRLNHPQFSHEFFHREWHANWHATGCCLTCSSSAGWRRKATNRCGTTSGSIALVSCHTTASTFKDTDLVFQGGQHRASRSPSVHPKKCQQHFALPEPPSHVGTAHRPIKYKVPKVHRSRMARKRNCRSHVHPTHTARVFAHRHKWVHA